MNYKLDLGKLNNIFIAPTELIDKYLNKATFEQLKLALYFFRHSGIYLTIDKISDDLKISKNIIESGISFWKKEGFNFEVSDKSQNAAIFSNELKNSVNESTIKNTFVKTTQKLDRAYIFKRMQSSDDIKLLMQEAEAILSRPLSCNDQSTLLKLHDSDGLPIDVILMLLQYSVGAGKIGIKYIEKVGEVWGKENVDTIEKAEKKIILLNKTNLSWKRFENIIEISHRAPTKKEEEAVYRWFEEWYFDDDLIREAYDRCVDANGKYILKYMDSIIKRWHDENITTLGQAMLELQNRKNAKRFNNQQPSSPSYNIDEYEKYNIFDYLEQ